MANSQGESISIYPILSVNFVGALGFGVVLPFLVFLVTRLGGNSLIYGIMGATYSFFQLIGAPILGRMSDRSGRKRVLYVEPIGDAGLLGNLPHRTDSPGHSAHRGRFARHRRLHGDDTARGPLPGSGA